MTVLHSVGSAIEVGRLIRIQELIDGVQQRGNGFGLVETACKENAVLMGKCIDTSSEQHDREACSQRSHTQKELSAVEFRHLEIENRKIEIKKITPEYVQWTIVDRDQVAVLFQYFTTKPGAYGIVIDAENAWLAGGCRSRRAALPVLKGEGTWRLRMLNSLAFDHYSHTNFRVSLVSTDVGNIRDVRAIDDCRPFAYRCIEWAGASSVMHYVDA